MDSRLLGWGAGLGVLRCRGGAPLAGGLRPPAHLRPLARLCRFERGEGEERLQCSCGAPNCTGFLN